MDRPSVPPFLTGMAEAPSGQVGVVGAGTPGPGSSGSGNPGRGDTDEGSGTNHFRALARRAVGAAGSGSGPFGTSAEKPRDLG